MRCVSKRLLSATVCALVALPQVNGVEKPGGGKPSDKVLQYLSALEKRPSPGYVFDRLYDAWLDTGSAEELQTYLAARVQAKSQANDMLLLAFLHRKEGRDPAALALLKQATTADPQHPSAWYYRAEVESGMLDFDAALNSVQTSATLAALSNMSDDDLLRRIVALQGRLLIRCGKRDQALVVWRSLVARKSGDFAEEIVDLAAAEGLLPEAIQDQKTLLAASDDPYVTVRRSLRLAELLGQANQRAEALAVLDQTLEKVAAGAWLEREILAAIERLYRRDDDIAGLSTHLGRLAQGSATRQGLRRRQAILLMETGRLEEAIAVSATIMAVHPGERRYVQEHAQLLLKAGKPEEAATVLESLIAADPKDASLLIRLAEVRQQLAKPEEVKALVKRFAALEEGTLASLQRIARTYERFTCIPEAEAIWRQAVKEHPTDAQAKEDLAAHLYRFEKKPEAIALWQEMAVTDAAGLLRAARALASRGEHLQAFTMLEARREQHADQEAWFSLYIQEAIIADKAAQAQWAGRRWVQLAQDVRSLEQAIESCLRLAIRTQSVSVLITELKALQNLSIRERCLLAWAYEHDNQAGSADALLFDAALSNEVLILSTRFRLQRLRQDWAAAAATLEVMLKLPEKTKAQTLRDVVEMHIRAGNHQAALTWIAQWRRSVPGSIETWLVESRLYQVLGKTEESLAVLRRGVSVLHPAQELREYLAQAYYTAGKFAESQRVFWRLYEDAETPEDQLRFIGTLAMLARNRNQEDAFVQLLHERRRGNRQSIQPLLALAQAHKVFNNHAERRQALVEASRIQGDNLSLLWEIAACEEEQGNTDAALASLERAKTLDHTPVTNGKIVRALFAAGRTEEAWQSLTQLASETGDPRQAEGLADLMAQHRDWPRMIAFLQPLCTKHPADYRLRFLLAMALEEDKNWEEAWTHFVDLFQVSEEMPGWKARSGFLNPQAQWQQRYQEERPQILQKYWELTWTMENAYRHHDRYRYGRWNSSFVMPGQVATTLELPKQVKELPPLAFAHLKNLSQRLGLEATDPRCSVLMTLLQKSDLAGLEPMLEIDCSLADLKERSPDHPLTLTLSVENAVDESDAVVISTQARMILAQHAQKHPAFSAIAALRAGSLEQDAKLLQQAQDLLSGIPKPSPFVLDALNSALGDGTEESGWKLHAAQRSFVIARLKSWYTQLQQDPSKNRADLFPSLASILKNSKDFEAWLALLEDELARDAALQNQGRGNVSHGYRRNDSFLSPLARAYFPDQVFEAIFSDDDTMFVWPDPSALIPLIAKVRDPRLRILLAQASGDANLVKESLDQALATHRRDPDVLVFAADQAGKDQRFPEAIALLEELRFQALDKNLRQRVDCALAHYAQQTQDQAGQAAGLQAVRRLARGYLNADQRSELVLALEVFGQSAEARDLQEKNLKNPGASSGTTLAARLEALIAEGKTDELVELFVRELRTQTSGGRLQDRDLELEIAKIARLGLTQAVLAKLTLPESAGVQQVLGQALILRMFGRTAEARRQYEELVRKNPKDAKVVIQMIPFLAPLDLEAARGYLAQIPEREREKLGDGLRDVLNSDSRTEAGSFPLIEVSTLCLEVLRSIEKPDRVDADWAASIQNRLQWGNLGTQAEEDEAEEDEANPVRYDLIARLEQGAHAAKHPPGFATFAKDQRDLYEALNRALLRFPKQAHSAFANLVKLAQLEHQALDPFVPLAKDLILAKPWQGSSDEARVFFDTNWRRPMEFLLRHTRSQGQQGVIFQELLPKLTSGAQRETQRRLESLAILNTCSESSFSATAAEILQNRRSGIGFYEVVALWKDRTLQSDLLPLISQGLAKESATNENAIYWLQSWLQVVDERQGIQGVKTAIETLIRQLIAPPETRAEILAQYKAPSQLGTAKLDPKLRSRIDRLKDALRTAANASSPGDLVCSALVAAASYSDLWPEDPLQNWTYRYVENVFQDLENPKRAKEALDRIARMPFFGRVEDFFVLRNSSGIPSFSDNPWCFLNPKLKSWLKGQERSFGRDLVLSLLDFQNLKQIPQRFYELCSQYGPAIATLTPNRQRDLAELGQGLVEKFARDKSWEPSVTARQGFDLLQKVLDAQIQKTVNTLMQAKSLDEIKTNMYEIRKFVAEIFPFVLRTQPDQLLPVCTKLAELAMKERGQASESWVGDTIRELADTSDLRVLPAIFHLLNLKGVRAATEQDFRVCGNLVQESFGAAPDEMQEQVFSPQKVLATAKRLEALVPEQSAWLVALMLLSTRKDGDAKMQEAVVALEGEASPQARAMAVALRLRLERALVNTDEKAEPKARFPPSAENLAALAALHPWMRQGEPALHRRELMLVVMDLPWQGAHEALVPDELVIKAWRSEKTPENSYQNSDHRLFHHLIRDPISATRSELARFLLLQHVARSNQNSSRDYPSSPYIRKEHYVQEDTDALMFQLALAHGDQAMAQRLAQLDSSGAEIGAIAALLTARSTTQAALLFHKNWRSMQARTWGRVMTPAIEAALPAFLQALENPMERLVAEAWILGLPDGKGEGKPSQDRSSRLRGLAQRISLKTSILTYADLILCSIVLSDEAAWDLLAPRLRPFAQHWNALSLRGRSWTDERLELERRLWGQLIVQRFLAGDDVLVQEVASLQRSSDSHRDGISALRSSLFRPLQEEIKQRFLQAQENEVLFSRILALETKENDFPEVQEIVLSLLAMGRSQEVANWYQNLGKNAKLWAAYRFSKYDNPYLSLSQLVKEHQGVPGPFMADKERVCLRILSDPTFAALRGTDEVLSSELLRFEILSKEELKDLGFQIARQSPHQGKTWKELAERLKDTDQYQAAADCYQEAAKAADTPENTARWTLEYLRCLLHLGQSDEARQKAKTYDISPWPPAQQEEWKKLFDKPQSATKALIP